MCVCVCVCVNLTWLLLINIALTTVTNLLKVTLNSVILYNDIFIKCLFIVTQKWCCTYQDKYFNNTWIHYGWYVYW